ncbi:bi-domain-containing oxidoreductase [bacterium]|nr:bi-domain-containing oxidoreductase [bacterium]
MKQVLQDLKTGEIQLVEIPTPQVQDGHILIESEISLISKGTEKMLLEFGKSGWINKARQQPDKVKQVIDKIKTDGFLSTYQSVKTKLDNPIPLGYCNSGIVKRVGKGVKGFEIGDRIISNGYHAEFVSVPQNLSAKIPAGVDSEDASFTVLGAIALQGVRLLNPTIGETIVVTGLGLVGLLTVQLLKANGCNVIGIDVDKQKLKLAKEFGAETINLTVWENSLDKVLYLTNNVGVDGVIITASSKSNEIVHDAAQMCRKRGKIILVGVVGLELSRSDFYEKELIFQVSCSYGPGRYDDGYELKGNDYPIGYVRWTEQRNFKAILELLNTNRLNVKPLITHSYKIAEATKAYETVLNDSSALGIILNYDSDDAIVKSASNHVNLRQLKRTRTRTQNVRIGLIGAGNYVSSTLLPNLIKTDAELYTIVSANGFKATHLGEKYNFQSTSTDPFEVINSPEINAIIIATQHDSHADLVITSIKANKPVFVEKPLAVNPAQLMEIEQLLKGKENPFIMIGFNRRFSPFIIKMKQMLDMIASEKTIIYTINAGAIPNEHWVHDPERGGGRIIGEVCHFIDLVRYLADSPIANVETIVTGARKIPDYTDDNITITLKFNSGSIATIHYLSTGHKSYPKERIEIFSGGKVLQLDNFRTLRGFGWSGFSSKQSFRQDKGHRQTLVEFVNAVKDGQPSPIPIDIAIEVTRTSFNILKL